MINFSIVLFLIARIIANPLGQFFSKKLSKEIPCSVICFYSYLLLSLSYFPFIKKYIQPETITPDLITLVIIAGVLSILGTLFFIKSEEDEKISAITPDNSFISIVGLFFAYILLNELPSIIAMLGILLIFTGSKIISDNPFHFSFPELKRKEVQYKLISFLFAAAQVVVLKKIIIYSSIETCFILWCFICCILSFLVLFVSKRTLKFDYRIHLMPLMIIAICIGFMQYAANYVLNNMNVVYALSLFQLSSIFTSFAGFKSFNKKEIIRKTIAACIMVCGSIFIVYLLTVYMI
ncbi:EamA family transporter [bacterium]|nr:EamA family transporter [bacterium]